MVEYSLDNLIVPIPCNASWSTMKGTSTVRLCSECDKHVYDLSELGRDTANSLLREKEGQLCVKFYQRRDGTVITSNCPEGLKAIRRGYLFAKARAAAIATAALALIGISLSSCAYSVIGVPPISIADTTHHSADTTRASVPMK